MSSPNKGSSVVSGRWTWTNTWPSPCRSAPTSERSPSFGRRSPDASANSRRELPEVGDFNFGMIHRISTQKVFLMNIFWWISGVGGYSSPKWWGFLIWEWWSSFAEIVSWTHTGISFWHSVYFRHHAFLWLKKHGSFNCTTLFVERLMGTVILSKWRPERHDECGLLGCLQHNGDQQDIIPGKPRVSDGKWMNMANE